MEHNTNKSQEESTVRLDVLDVVQQLGIDMERLKATNLFPEEIARYEKRKRELE